MYSSKSNEKGLERFPKDPLALKKGKREKIETWNGEKAGKSHGRGVGRPYWNAPFSYFEFTKSS